MNDRFGYALRPALAGAVVAVLACGGDGVSQIDDDDPPEEVLALETVVTGLQLPVHLTAPAGDDRLFVVEQPGRIRIVAGDTLVETPFLDITDRVQSGGEQGLLSVAFHPDYGTNGRFLVNYTDLAGNTRIEEYTVSADPDVADTTTARVILGVDQPASNHNGGLVAFGPDGYLWIGMGDGGSAGDPYGNGQDSTTLLGALLRIDVDGGDPYAIPPNNPFADSSAAPEVWAYGLRNPWRFSIDVPEGRLYIADVGQNAWEEVHAAPVTAAGLNYGWNILEGSHCYGTSSCDATGLETPIVEYDHLAGCSITGGHVYRGQALTSVVGHYFYGDYCGGWVASFHYDGTDVTDHVEYDFGDIGGILSFGRDAASELYVLTDQGTVYRLVADE